MRLGILGNGKLAGVVVEAWEKGLLAGWEIVGIVGRTPEKTAALAKRAGCAPCATVEELLAQKPDVVAECASVQAVRDGAEAILRAGADLAVISIGAFSDKDFYAETAQAAQAGGGKVYLCSGAIGGFDVLRTVSLMGQAKASMETRKGPKSLENTPVYTPDMADTEKVAFSGTPAQAIELLPTKVNVAVAAGLSTTGPAEMNFTIHSIPGFVGDDHKITVEAPGIKAVVDVYSETSHIAGWSLVALLRELSSPIRFF